MKIIPHEITDCGRTPGEAADCSVRALAHCLGIGYGEAHAKMAAFGRKDRCGFSFRNWAANLEALGLEQRPDLSCMTLERALPEMSSGRFICRVSGHFFAVVDGRVMDSWHQKPRRRLLMVYQPLAGNHVPEIPDAE